MPVFNATLTFTKAPWAYAGHSSSNSSSSHCHMLTTGADSNTGVCLSELLLLPLTKAVCMNSQYKIC